ncbi:MAG: HD-GYP domain-containing protein [Candidatus Zixiibacteriota bacterium]
MISGANDPTVTGQLTPAEEAASSRYGTSLVNHLCILLKTAKIYDRDNNSFVNQLSSLSKLVNELLQLYGDVTLQTQSGYLFFCNVRLRAEYDTDSNAAYLMDLFQNLNISGLMIDVGVSEEQLVEMARILNEAETIAGSDFDSLRRRFSERQIEYIEVLPQVYESSERVDEVRRTRQIAKRTFFSAISNLKSVVTNIGANKNVDLTRTTRIVHSLVDQVVADDRYLLELTALRAHDEYTFLHSTNVCVYAICLGAAMDLSKAELANLGFAALFHDIGKTRLPLQILNKPTEFDEAEWELMRKHPTYGVLAIAKTMPFDEQSCRAMLVAFEHHFNLDGTGYPLVQFRRVLNLYSKIVAICDVFDALTSGRIYRKDPMSPEHVLRTMMDQAGHKFDPLLLKVFIKTVSVYPPGSLLLLDNRSLALVVARNSHDLFRPVVKIIGNMNGLYEMAEEVDLSRHNEVGQYVAQIVRSVEPQELPVNLSNYILQSFN